MTVEVKICGLTNSDDAAAALDSGADYLGFILYSESPRGITADKLINILDKIDASGKVIGVFVNEACNNVRKISEDCALHAIQFHGDENPADFSEMPCSVWRAVKCQDNTFVPSPEKWKAARYVIDAAVPGMYGGTGITADWTAAAKFASQYPVMLSGGLTPDNIAKAIHVVRPIGVDTASGVESVPGKKDHGKMRDFIKNAKAVL
ncbi:N-(5'-phosphoribosyl)anthranilate isomerase [Verrucomicrobiota bacterium]